MSHRVAALSYLSSIHPFQCQVMSQLSAPQTQKYLRAFPDEKKRIENWNEPFQWTAFESRCEVHAQNLSPAIANDRAFVDMAFCTLMQVFWVNSPFDELTILPEDIQDRDGQVFLRLRDNSDFGIYMDKKSFKLETRTMSHGSLSAVYQLEGGRYVPSLLTQKTLQYELVVDKLEWSADLIDGRHFPTSFWISLKTNGDLQAHTGITVSKCQAL